MKENANGSAPLVSVLLASHDHERFVEEAVRSAMSQEGVPFELVVVDDGSADRSPEILERLRAEFGFRLVVRPNRGLVPTMNELLSMARGKYVCSLASDDVMPPDRLRLQSAFLEARPEAAACYGQVVNMDENGRPEPGVDRRFLRSCPSVSFEDQFLGRKALHGCAEMYVREKIAALGGYDERFFFEDIPLNLKVLREYGPQPVLSDVVCCFYRLHGGNLHANEDRVFAEILRMLEDYAGHPLHAKAVRAWKAHWFSAVAERGRVEAARRIPELGSLSFAFAKRLPKLFLPRFVLGR